MLQDYGVRVIRAYENRIVGQVFYPPGLLRDALVRKGLVERIAPPIAPKPTQAVERPNRRAGRDISEC